MVVALASFRKRKQRVKLRARSMSKPEDAVVGALRTLPAQVQRWYECSKHLVQSRTSNVPFSTGANYLGTVARHSKLYVEHTLVSPYVPLLPRFGRSIVPTGCGMLSPSSSICASEGGLFHCYLGQCVSMLKEPRTSGDCQSRRYIPRQRRVQSLQYSTCSTRVTFDQA